MSTRRLPAAAWVELEARLRDLNPSRHHEVTLALRRLVAAEERAITARSDLHASLARLRSRRSK